MHKKIVLAAVMGVALAACQTQPVEETAPKAAAAKPAPAEKAPPKLMMGADAAMLANTCAGCHGTHGASTGPAAPTIGGLSEDYLVEVMEAYKSGDRAGTIMGRIAKGYNEAEIAAIAKHYAAQPYVGQMQTSMGPKATAGKKLHDEYCEKCHEDGGKSVEDDSGLLAGQWMPYLHYTLDDYAAGKNAMEKKMKKAIETMLAEHGPSSIENLVNYYGSQK